MKVYVLFIEQVFDCCQEDRKIRVFNDYDKALKEWNVFVKKEKEVESDWVTTYYGGYYESYEEGYYENNHSIAYIYDIEVE